MFCQNKRAERSFLQELCLFVILIDITDSAFVVKSTPQTASNVSFQYFAGMLQTY